MVDEIFDNDEEDNNDTCEGDHCIEDLEVPPKLWHCVQCDSTYCEYDWTYLLL